MKKILPILSLALVLFACKKTNKTEIQLPEKKYEVNFTVSDFNQDVVALGKTSSKVSAVGDTLKNYANNLYYKVFNSAGVLVNTIDQTSSSTSFGTITDKLPSGSYTVSIVASKGVLHPTSSTGYTGSFYPSGETWDDTFAKQIEFSVGTSNISQAVRLDRSVGGMEVTLLDAIPSNVAKITLIFQSDTWSHYYNGATQSPNYSRTKQFSLTASDTGVKNKAFFMFVGNTWTASNVIIRAYDSANGLIAEKTVPNVRVYKNKKTLLTGTLFPATANPSVGFTVTVNPIWDVSGTPITF